jgi:hypothetical protein
MPVTNTGQCRVYEIVFSCSDTMTVTGRCPSRFRCRCSVTRSVFVIRIETP